MLGSAVSGSDCDDSPGGCLQVVFRRFFTGHVCSLWREVEVQGAEGLFTGVRKLRLPKDASLLAVHDGLRWGLRSQALSYVVFNGGAGGDKAIGRTLY